MVRNLCDGDELEHLYTPVGGYMANFAKDYAEVIFSIVCASILVAYGYGLTSNEIEGLKDDLAEAKTLEKADITSLANQVSDIQRNGTSVSQSHKFLLEQHGKEIVEIKADNRQISQDLTEIKTDVRLISAWVKQQNGGKANLINSLNPDDCE